MVANSGSPESPPVKEKETRPRLGLKVLILKDRYQSSFMSPRQSRHSVHRSSFLPFNKLRPQWDGFTLLPPRRGIDLVHTHNRIPLAARRFICSFESALPRIYGLNPDGPAGQLMRRAVLSDKCRRLIAMSHYARREFLDQHADLPERDLLTAKLMVRHPNVELGPEADRLADDAAEELVVTFVGGHFGRKGGAACVRAAEMALTRGLPVRFNIISSLTVGAEIWTDPTKPGFFDAYLEKLSLPNIHFSPQLPNAEVRELLGRSHFCLLPTFSDTFGFSMIEAMAEHTPVIATDVAAVPEVVDDGFNGYLLSLATTPRGDWLHHDYNQRHTEAYARRFRETTEALAEAIVGRLEQLIGQSAQLRTLRRQARLTAERMFSAAQQGALWDDLYERAAREPVSDPASTGPEDVSSPENIRDLLRDAAV